MDGTPVGMRPAQVWVMLGFSVALAASTLLDDTREQVSALNGALVALLLLACAAIEIAGLHVWMDRVQVALGTWLATYPFLLPHVSEGAVVSTHAIMGILLAGFAACSLIHGRLEKKLKR